VHVSFNLATTLAVYFYRTVFRYIHVFISVVKSYITLEVVYFFHIPVDACIKLHYNSDQIKKNMYGAMPMQNTLSILVIYVVLDKT